MKHLTIDYYELADRALNVLMASPAVTRAHLTHRYVSDAIFKWIDGYYLQSIMRWCDAPYDGLDNLVSALGGDLTRDNDDTGYDEAHDVLVDGMNDLIGQYINGAHGCTWFQLSVLRNSNTSFILIIGEDYRIRYYMDNVVKPRIKKKRPTVIVQQPVKRGRKPNVMLSRISTPAQWINRPVEIEDEPPAPKTKP
jgi:hypothetical protein